MRHVVTRSLQITSALDVSVASDLSIGAERVKNERNKVAADDVAVRDVVLLVDEVVESTVNAFVEDTAKI